MQDGETVAALDTDPQGSLAGWGQRREADGVAIERVEPAAIKGALDRLRRGKATSLVVIDTPGYFGAGVALALREASLCLLPVKPSILDVEAARPTVEQLRLLGKPFAFVLNQCNATTQARTLDAATALVSTGALAPSMVATRSDFLDAMTTGQGVTELAPKGKAAIEIRLLWQWIKAQIAGVQA
jgi:chromosome partitioning protein